MKHLLFIKKAVFLVLLFIILDFLISVVLIHGYKRYYGFKENPEVLINGSSMAMAGFNRTEIQTITKMQVATYTHEGVSVFDRYAMIRHFFHMYPEGTATVVYEVNPILFSSNKSAENVYSIFFPFMDDKSINAYIKERASIKEYFVTKIIRTTRFDSRLMKFIVMGYLNRYENVKSNSLDSIAIAQLFEHKYDTEVSMDQSNIEVFEMTMEYILSNNSDIILVMMPMFHNKLETFNKEGYMVLCNYFIEYSGKHERIEFLDLNQDSLIYNPAFFSDPLHFNAQGQKFITTAISSYLTRN